MRGENVKIELNATSIPSPGIVFIKEVANCDNTRKKVTAAIPNHIVHSPFQNLFDIQLMYLQM